MSDHATLEVRNEVPWSINSPRNPPRFEISNERWTNLRQRNVDGFADFWAENLNAVRVLTDKKLGRNQVVMLRKDAFEALLSLARSMSDVEVDFNMLRGNIEVLEDYVEEHDEVTGLIKKIVKTISMSVERFSGTATLRRHRVSRKPPTLSPEEAAELEAEEKVP